MVANWSDSPGTDIKSYFRTVQKRLIRREYKDINRILILRQQGMARAVQNGSVFIIIPEVLPNPPVGDAVEVGIFVDWVMVAEVDAVGIRPAAVLGRVGGHGLEFGQ